MKLSNVINNAYRRCGLSGIFVFTLMVVMSSPAIGLAQVGLYDVWETKVTNSKSYSNPFDFNVIELQATFTSPSGKKFNFFGFYDGNGNGGQNGNVWKLRFMPDKLGPWKYTYSWTDGTSGGSGSFNVVDTGLPGPLKVANDNSWYFQDARGNPFHFRGYSLHFYLEGKYGRGINNDAAWTDLISNINAKVANRKYNAVMLAWPVITASGWPAVNSNAGHHFWQQNGSQVDFTQFNISQWRNVERSLRAAATRKVYVFQFLAQVDQFTSRPNNNNMTSYLRYMAARLGPFWNNFGYSATWEFNDIWSKSFANSVMTQLSNNLSGLPTKPLLTIHDNSDNGFGGWLDVSMHQNPTTDILTGNCRNCGQHGGVGSSFLNRPIIGSENIWEQSCGNRFGQPCNGAEVRRGAWGNMMAGVMPVYLEYAKDTLAFKGQGESEVRRMFDFFYSKTQYRQYKQLNHLVSKSARQIASGIAGKEYLVYDENGGSIIINLSDAGGSNTFNVLWYNPTSGATQNGGKVNGGDSRTLHSPYSGDTVLLLTKGASDISAPQAPRSLTLTTK